MSAPSSWSVARGQPPCSHLTCGSASDIPVIENLRIFLEPQDAVWAQAQGRPVAPGPSECGSQHKVTWHCADGSGQVVPWRPQHPAVGQGLRTGPRSWHFMPRRRELSAMASSSPRRSGGDDGSVPVCVCLVSAPQPVQSSLLRKTTDAGAPAAALLPSGAACSQPQGRTEGSGGPSPQDLASPGAGALLRRSGLRVLLRSLLACCEAPRLPVRGKAGHPLTAAETR